MHTCTYTYNAYNEPTDSPDVYTASFTSDGKALGTGELNSPTDITSGNDGNIYITDCKNNRIIKLDSEYRTVHVYTEFSFEGKKQTLNSPTNVFVSADGTLYISDNGNQADFGLQQQWRNKANPDKAGIRAFPAG